MIDVKHKALLQEVLDCQNCVNDSEFDDEDKAILQSLKEEGLIQLCWVVTTKGKRLVEHE